MDPQSESNSEMCGNCYIMVKLRWYCKYLVQIVLQTMVMNGMVVDVMVYGIVDPNRGYIRESTLEELVKAHVHIVVQDYQNIIHLILTVEQSMNIFDECIPD